MPARGPECVPVLPCPLRLRTPEWKPGVSLAHWKSSTGTRFATLGLSLPAARGLWWVGAGWRIHNGQSRRWCMLYSVQPCQMAAWISSGQASASRGPTLRSRIRAWRCPDIRRVVDSQRIPVVIAYSSGWATPAFSAHAIPAKCSRFTADFTCLHMASPREGAGRDGRLMAIRGSHAGVRTLASACRSMFLPRQTCDACTHYVGVQLDAHRH